MGILGGILQAAGTVVGAIYGGPVGAKIGGALGGAVGGAIEGNKDKKQSQEAALLAGRQQAEANQQAFNFLGQQTGQAQGILDPFAPQDGQANAFNLQQAYSGALGPEAQQQAFDQFQFDPGVDFLRKQGLEAIDRNQAAVGGVGGGNRLKRLSEYNQGLALNSLNNRVGQLQNITNVQAGAAGQQAGIGVNLATAGANAIIGKGSSLAAGTIGAENANISGKAGINSVIGQAGQVVGPYLSGLFSGGTGGIVGGAKTQPGFNVGSIVAPSGGNFLNVPGGFTGGMPIGATGGNFTGGMPNITSAPLNFGASLGGI